MQSSPENKRRKTTSPNDGDIISFANLPHDHITTIAEYLPITSRALLAVALTASSDAFVKEWVPIPNDASQAIISMPKNEGWYRLTFGDIDSSLAARLTDHDVHAVLSVIDAKSKLKLFCLHRCNKVVGHGLEPLRKSVVLECIALSLPLERISTHVIIPIIDSIIETEGNKLNEIGIFEIIHAKNDPQLREYIERYKKLLVIGDNCPGCEEKIERMNLKGREPSNGHMICIECFKFTCDLCNDYVDRCAIRKCTHCELTFCGDHATTWNGEPDPNICYGCRDFHCHRCTKLDHVGSAQACWCYGDKVHEEFCTDCILKNRESRSDLERMGACEVCESNHFGIILAQREKYKEVGDELAEKNKQLTGENKQLHEEIDELRKKMSSGLGILG